MDRVFKNAQEAFESLYDEIDSKGFQNGNGTELLLLLWSFYSSFFQLQFICWLFLL